MAAGWQTKKGMMFRVTAGRNKVEDFSTCMLNLWIKEVPLVKTRFSLIDDILFALFYLLLENTSIPKHEFDETKSDIQPDL